MFVFDKTLINNVYLMLYCKHTTHFMPNHHKLTSNYNILILKQLQLKLAAVDFFLQTLQPLTSNSSALFSSPWFQPILNVLIKIKKIMSIVSIYCNSILLFNSLFVMFIIFSRLYYYCLFYVPIIILTNIIILCIDIELIGLHYQP